MISIEDQQKMLLNVSRRLKSPVTVYAIGGTAMMFFGFKDATLDIDLVFEDEAAREVFKQAIIEIGYRKMDAVKIYRDKKNVPEMFTLGDDRFDLFVDEVITFKFSGMMRKRAEAVHQFGDKLVVKVAAPQDIVLLKCATDRAKDMDDARRIIETVDIDWEELIHEAKNQISLGKSIAALELGEFLEDLNNAGVPIPEQALDMLFKIVMKQGEEKQKRR